MHELAIRHPGSGVSVQGEQAPDLAREFEQRLAECSTLVFRVAMGVLHNREDAEDVAQEAFLRAYQSLHQLRDRERFRDWIARIAWRLAIDRWRSAGRRDRRQQRLPDEVSTPTVEDAAASSEFQRRLERALDELPEKLRLVMILAAIEGHSLSDVAQLLGLAEGTVKSRLHFARKQLAEKLRWTASDAKKV